MLLCAKSNTHQNMIHKIDSPSRESLPVTSSARQNRRDYSWLSRRAACSLQGRNRVLTQAPALPRAGSSSTRSTEPVRWVCCSAWSPPAAGAPRAGQAGGAQKSEAVPAQTRTRLRITESFGLEKPSETTKSNHSPALTMCPGQGL